MMYPASQELKEAIEEICPNEFGLLVPDWLKLASKRIGIDYERLSRLWRDNRAKIHRYEVLMIEDALYEVRLSKNQLRSKYLQHKFGEQENERTLSEGSVHHGASW